MFILDVHVAQQLYVVRVSVVNKHVLHMEQIAVLGRHTLSHAVIAVIQKHCTMIKSPSPVQAGLLPVILVLQIYSLLELSLLSVDLFTHLQADHGIGDAAAHVKGKK